jgi:hypothetical protein
MAKHTPLHKSHPRGGFNQNSAFAMRPNAPNDSPQPSSPPRPIGASRESWAEHLKEKSGG